ncbi:MAG: NAD-dependent epimerase/dehydratase family protein, partial [Anaerolineae bacterium]|nr:NAD-dependent epimerase/dehydratase family protein [Anaerolineae bacterium]MDW8070739.1 NAD-dependent epimerase/dehydratase family protein [Anaerolineae bacterium]
MGRTILVTGGSGLLGSYVMRQLAERGDQVINFDTREPTGELAWWLKPVVDRIRFVAGGVDMWGDIAAVVREFAPEVIVHTA